jgi:ABC-2 type transport system permease protein
MTVAQNLRVILALSRRALNEILRVPGASIPGVLAPAIFLIGISGVFGEVARLPGFDATDFRTFIVPVGMLQGAGFSGAATGVNLARDIEEGWFDRLVAGPASRSVLLVGIVASACLRALLPATFLVLVALALGSGVESLGGLLLAVPLVMGMAAAMACWGSIVALRFGTQQAAPLMQVVAFASILLSTAYAPKELLAGWLADIVTVNPVNYLLEGVRQAFVYGVGWERTWQALLALALMLAVLGGGAATLMRRVGR